MKDYSVKYKKNIENDYRDIQFILFPCDLELNTYMLVEPNPYMIKMKKAKVIIESVIQRCGYDYKDHYYPIGKFERIIDNYDELIQYLFSLDKTKYFNKLMKMSDYQDIPPYQTIHFCFFSIRIYDESDKVIYKKKINTKEEVRHSEIYISPYFEAGNITDNIRDIYFSELSLFKESISIDPIRNLWDLGHDEYKYNLCALWLEQTNTISFFHMEDMNRIEKVTDMFVRGIVFPCFIDHKKEFNTSRHAPSSNCPQYDLALFDYPLIMEYITYLPYINMLLRMCAKIANQEYADEGMVLSEDDYYVNTRIDINIYYKNYTTSFNDHDPFTIEKLMNLLELEGD